MVSAWRLPGRLLEVPSLRGVQLERLLKEDLEGTYPLGGELLFVYDHVDVLGLLRLLLFLLLLLPILVCSLILLLYRFFFILPQAAGIRPRTTTPPSGANWADAPGGSRLLRPPPSHPWA